MSLEQRNFSALDANRDYFKAVLPFSVVLGLLSAIGSLGNTFILYVYTFKYPLCNFKYFVIVLGAIDLLSCLLTIPGEIYTQYTWFRMPSVGLCKAKSFFNVATVSCSSIVLLLISVDRYRKICRPHRWQIRPVNALRLSVSLSIVTFIWSTPAIIFCGPQTYEMNYKGSNVTVTVCLKDDEYKNTIWLSLIMKAVYVGPNGVIMATAVFLYCLIARAIFKRTKQARPSLRVSTSNRPMKASTYRDNTMEVSETNNDPSIIDSEYVPMHPNGHRKDNEISTSPSSTFDRKIGMIATEIQPSTPVLDYRRVTNTSPVIQRRRPNIKRINASVVRRRGHARVRRKTLIMFILTAFFVTSTGVYFILASQISDKGVFFQDMSLWQEITVMFFFRFYYFNSLINAIVYGILDPRFRRAVRRVSRRLSRSITSISHL